MGKEGGSGQKIVTYSDFISTILNLFSSFTNDKMIPHAITVHDKFIIIKENNLLNIQECPGILATRGGSHLTSDIPFEQAGVF